MARDQVDMTPIETRNELVAWFEAGSKPKSQFRIGTEHEKFVFTVEGHRPVPYDGRRSIRALLEGMQYLLGWEPIVEDGNVIGLFDVTGGGAISLEPGGQFELSGAPVESVHQTSSELMAHLAQVKEVARPLGIGFLGLGMTPNWSRAEIPTMPKGRYRIMTAYMPKVGRYGLDMMYRTCTVQTNLDYSSEADMVKKLRVSLALQPVATAMFANSPFTEGKPNGFLSFRSEIWRDTDPDRSGMLPWAFEPGMGFERYVDYALSVPMYFVKRGDHYIDVAGQSFRDLMEGRLPGLPGERATISDWANHISTIFPEVRLKRYLEMRGADGGPWRQVAGAAGLLGRHPLRRRRRSMPPGTWSRAGQPPSVRNCATMCRSLVSRRRLQAVTSCNWRRPRSRSRKRDLRDAGGLTPAATTKADTCNRSRNTSRAVLRRPRSCWINSTAPGRAAWGRCSGNTHTEVLSQGDVPDPLSLGRLAMRAPVPRPAPLQRRTSLLRPAVD